MRKGKTILELPWPSSRLNPNARPGHWAVTHRAVKKYRSDCHYLAKSFPPAKEFSVKFHPPCNRSKRNIDNTITAMKAGIDGLQDAWGIDDSQFIIHWPTAFSAPVKGGKVLIEVRA